MNSRERVLGHIAGRPVDRLPLMPITMQFACDLIGAKYRDYATDYRVLVEAQMRAAEQFDFDYVNTMSDPAREAADCGATVEFFENAPAAIVEERAVLGDKTRLATLTIPDPFGGGRMHNGVKAIALFREKLLGERLVEGWIEGPVAEAADLRGLNTLMLDFYDDPVFVRDLFEFVVEMELRFAQAQVEAGVDLIGVGDAAASLVGPQIYEQFVWPYEKKLIDGLHALGAQVRLHICGNTRFALDGMGRLGCEIVDLDSLSPIGEARARMGASQILLGNINPVTALREGNPETVFQALAECYRQAGPRYIVGAGCEVPRDTPPGNVRALFEFARSLRPNAPDPEEEQRCKGAMNETGPNSSASEPSAARSVVVTLRPLGRTLPVERGTPLRDLLFAQGVEFPCGGRGRCKGCRIRVLAGELPATEEDARLLTVRELGDGWRLACQAAAEEDLILELEQWDATILTDTSAFDFTPRDGLGVAIDLGTTTLAGQLLDLRTGRVLAVRTALNAQARHGGDIVSRLDYAVHHGGNPVLQELIREQIRSLVGELLANASSAAIALRDVVLVGNTVMHHLFCGLDPTRLSVYPFESDTDKLQLLTAQQLGWHEAPYAPGSFRIAPGTRIRFLPGLGSFVGSDLLAGILATRMHENQALSVLVDIGTNGEIVVGNCERLLCASTAAGPAFEGARISCGMRAATGAIAEVSLAEGRLNCRVIGRTAPRGICGSGLVDAVACALDLGLVQPDGKLAHGCDVPLTPSVSLLPVDIRELQVAKGAIAAGIRILLQQWGAKPADVGHVWLAGAFGNYINRASARRIGLLDFPPEKVVPAGNTALLGAKLALFNLPSEPGGYDSIRARVQHVPLNEDPRFVEVFVDEMRFPE